MCVRILISFAAAIFLTACQPGQSERTGPQTSRIGQSDQGRTVLVSTPDAYTRAVQNARPGDTIVLENGLWTDFDMLLEAEGEADRPVTVRAETPGEVILSGQSSMRLAGRHLLVSGLVFRDGYTPRPEVITFRRDQDNLAFDSRVTETVIENYSNPNRAKRDLWVTMYGQNNTFDRNHLGAKLNAGPTMAVRLTTEDSQNNNHIIQRNYFAPRPTLGSNGGELLQIGTSQYSLQRSGTRVINNYFDRFQGEVEIVSSKSTGNTFKGNTFYQSNGTLTLRHGNDSFVENNLFDGGGSPNTGGVRIINAGQTVRNNLFKRLTGRGFSGALVIMNGVPDSPLHRYHQVENAVVESNVFVDIDRIELGEGADTERSAEPINSVFKDNVVFTTRDDTPFQLYADMSGIEFANNTTNRPPPPPLASGFDVVSDYAPPTASYGVAREQTGVSWRALSAQAPGFDSGKRIYVAPGPDALSNAVASANAGDTLILKPGLYSESKFAPVRVPITIQAAGGKPTITFSRPNLFVLSGEGRLRLSGIEVSGKSAPDAPGNSFITTTSVNGAGNHTVELQDMTFVDCDVNRGFSVIAAAKGTFYDTINIVNSQFSDVSGAVIKLDTETDDYGIYNAEYITIEDSRFENIGGSVVSVYRGGRDESTFGPNVSVSGSRFNGIGLRGRPFMRLHGVQTVELIDNDVKDAAPADFVITTGDPVVVAEGNSVDQGVALMETTDLRN